jgi:ABC-type branched-subunit amino acid transport system substrate-binding protein
MVTRTQHDERGHGPFRWFGRLSRLVRAAIVLGALALAVVLGWLAVMWATTCDDRIAWTDGQCIGVVSDGVADDVFGAGTADVLARVQEENARVETSGRPFVSVAYLLPLPREGGDRQLADQLRRDLVGAHVAQRRANHTRTLGEAPLVRLLVANHGDSAGHWREVVPALVGMAGDASEDRLVAVAVSGESLTNTTHAIDALVGAGVPVLTVRLTADLLTSTPPTPDVALARIAPTNTDEANAAATYLRPLAGRVMIVQDSNPDDAYARSLGDAFRASFPDDAHHIVEPTEYFDSGRGSVANTMPLILSSICLNRPDALYFAGRSPALEALVQALPFRPCPDLRITIVTGDAVRFATEPGDMTPELRRGLESNAELVYTGIAHPGGWAAAPGAFQAGSVDYLTATCPDCLPRLFPGEDLNDGAVITGYDVVVAAVSAVRLGAGVNDTAPLVAQQLKRMHGTHAVPGASGWLSFAATGEARDKALPVLRVQPDGTQEFLQLTSPDGAPCVPDGVSC